MGFIREQIERIQLQHLGMAINDRMLEEVRAQVMRILMDRIHGTNPGWYMPGCICTKVCAMSREEISRTINVCHDIHLGTVTIECDLLEVFLLLEKIREDILEGK